MNKKHEKSACCRANVIKYGRRRRQCTVCRKTWSVWQKRRGRKKKRTSAGLVTRFLNREISSLAALARQRGCSEAYLQQALRRSREHFLETTPWRSIPLGHLILIADAVAEMVEQKWRTVYLMLARTVGGNEAIILPPLILPGTETVEGWRSALNTISQSAQGRIVAIVCDGHRGLVSEGTRRGWILQRCHFHLLARIQSQRSRSRTARHTHEAKRIFSHTRLILKSTDQVAIRTALNTLEEIGWLSTSREIQKVLSGFVTNYRDYRSYLMHPDLRLPITNNTAESLGSIIADLKRRMRGFSTVQSFEKWIFALLKFKKKIICNGFYQQN